MRTVGSTVVAQLISSVIFIPMVFLFVIPTPLILQMILIQWIVKCVIEIVLTPLVYFLSKKLKKAEGLDVVLTKESSINPFSLSLDNKEVNRGV